MTKKSKINIARWFVFLLLLLLIDMLQNTSGLFPQVFGARALLLVPAVACLGMFEKETAGALFGLFAGLLWDTVSVQHSGFNSVFLMIFGCFCGLMVSHLMQNTLLSALILGAGGSVLYVLLYWLFFLALPRDADMWQVLVRFYLPSALYTILTAPFLYLILRFIRKHMRAIE